MLHSKSILSQLAKSNTSAFGRCLRLVVLSASFWLSMANCYSVDILYVGLDDNSVASYDLSFTTQSAIAASKQTYVTGLSGPRGLAFDTSGNLYVANDASNSISRVTSGGALSLFASMSRPNGLAFDSSGNLFAGNDASSSISKVTSDGTVSNFASSGLISNPREIVFNNNGDLFVANGAINSVVRITPNGTVSTFVNTGVDTLIGLTIDNNSNLYASNYYWGTITKITPGGITSQFTSGLNRPTGLGFDSSGYLYAANNNDKTISKIDNNGNIIFSFSTGNAKPLYLAIRSIPEPSTYLLGSIAATSLALVLRRRNRLQIKS